MKKSNKQLYNYYKNKPRDIIELWVDLHNRKFELIRTIASSMAFILQIIILLKIFGRI